MAKHIITVTTAKGGCSKTTTVASLSQAAALDGKRVLMIDLDPQKSLSFWYQAKDTGKTAYNIFLDGDIRDAIQTTDFGVDLVPGSGNLIAVKTATESARRLEKAVTTVRRQYDYIFIDTGPGLGELQNNSIFAASEILIPAEGDILSINGLLTIKGIIDKAKSSKRNLRLLGAFTAMYDRRTTADRELRNMVEDYCRQIGVPYLGEVRRCTKVKEALAMRTPLYDYAPKCNAAVDYLELYHRIEGDDHA